MSTLFIAGTTAIILLSLTWYFLLNIITFEIGEIPFNEVEKEQLNNDFKGGLRNVGRNN
tara:strand:+ start:5045 stop:5221 length:177 start_codon:yes stop_codon:yes gene_type:complete